jgi:hypothetical protein
MKNKIVIIISIIVLLFIGLVIRARIANTPTKKIIVFVKPNNYKESIDNSVEPNTIELNANSKVETNVIIDVPTSVIIGTWNGEMDGKKLTVVIDKLNGNEISGYNILGTNKRLLKGTFIGSEWGQACSKAYDATLNEPGDDKWDGVFTIKFVGYEDQDETNNGIVCKGNLKGQEAEGSWKSNNGKLKKEFNLTKIK